MLLSSVLLVMLQLSSLQPMAVTKPVCHLRRYVVETAHHLLRDLGGPFPVECVQYNANISFPDSVFPAAAANPTQCRQALWVVYESLKGAARLFEEQNLTIAEVGLDWDEDKFDTFQNLQNRLEGEGSCLSGVMTSDVLSLYFSNVSAVVQQQDSAACGWMALRRDLLWVLKSALQKHHNCFTSRHAH